MLSSAHEIVLANLLPGESFRSVSEFIEAKAIRQSEVIDSIEVILRDIAKEGLIEFDATKNHAVKVIATENIGPDRLIRKFCRKNYGKVSPLIPKKTVSAVLRRHGAPYSLDDAGVKAALSKLEEEGLIRIKGQEQAFLKILGAE